MKKVHFDQKNGTLKILIDQPEDTWYLSSLIDTGDIVVGLVSRKISVGGEGEKGSTARKTMMAHIRVEKIEIGENEIKISGPITGGGEELPRGSYQTIHAGMHDTIAIHKTHFGAYHNHILREAASAEANPIIICVHDREEAFLAKTNKSGYDLLLHLAGDVARKGVEGRSQDFYKELTNEIGRYVERYSSPSLLVASPAFFKEDLAKGFSAELLKKTIFATCSSVTKNGIDEVLKRPEARAALANARVREELTLVDELFLEISKNGLFSYGWKDTMHAATSRAVKALLLSESFVKRLRSETPAVFEKLLRDVESSGGTLNFISDHHEGGARLNGIGGIGAILRYKMYGEP